MRVGGNPEVPAEFLTNSVTTAYCSMTLMAGAPLLPAVFSFPLEPEAVSPKPRQAFRPAVLQGTIVRDLTTWTETTKLERSPFSKALTFFDPTTSQPLCDLLTRR